MATILNNFLKDNFILCRYITIQTIRTQSNELYCQVKFQLAEQFQCKRLKMYKQ